MRLTDEDFCALEYTKLALQAIANRKEQIGDLIHPMNDIRSASKRARAAIKRLEPVMNKIDSILEQSAVLVVIKWQPMETAPKTGEEVLVTNGKDWWKAAWLDSRVSRRDPAFYCWSIPDSWQDEQGGYTTLDGLTGWAPAPALLDSANEDRQHEQ